MNESEMVMDGIGKQLQFAISHSASRAEEGNCHESKRSIDSNDYYTVINFASKQHGVLIYDRFRATFFTYFVNLVVFSYFFGSFP